MSAEVEFFHDHVSHYLIGGQSVRVIEVDLRDTAREAVVRHQAGEIATVAMAQALVAAALLGGHIKGDEKLTLQAIGRGNLGGLMADCTAEGDLRVWVKYPEAVAPGKTLRDRVRAGIGDGSIYVIKSTRQKELYRGTSPMSHADLGEALEVYFEVSEQVASLSWMTVQLEEGGVKRAHGLLIQSLGGGDREAFAALAGTVDRAGIAGLLEAGEQAPVVLERIFPGAKVEMLETRPLRFQCSCSVERVAATLLALGPRELEDMLVQDGQAEVTCDFCRSVYHFDGEQLARLLNLARGVGSDEPAN